MKNLKKRTVILLADELLGELRLMESRPGLFCEIWSKFFCDYFMDTARMAAIALQTEAMDEMTAINHSRDSLMDRSVSLK